MAEGRKRRRLSVNGTFQTNEEVNAEAPHDAASPQDAPKKKSRRNTLFVRSLPATVTTETLTRHFSQSYPLKHATVVLDPQTKTSRGFGFVTFVDPDDAQQAGTDLNGSILEGRKIKVEIAEPRHREVQETAGGTAVKSVPSVEAARLKAERQSQKIQASESKLIVRNLPWSVKDAEGLAVLFRSYGKVKHATIPKKNPRVLSGFGFVVMRGRKNAEKAIEGVNGKEIDGRTLAVDWAVDKTVWDELQKAQPEEDQAATSENVEEVEAGKVDDHGEADDIAEGESGSAITDASSVALSEDESDMELDDEDKTESAKTSNREDSTVFVRNVPFTADDEALYEHFSQLGPLRYARVVLDPETERARGTGFVCFVKPEDAVSCLRQAPKSQLAKKSGDTTATKHSILENEAVDPSGQYTFEGRVLQVSKAVSKDEAAKLEDENTAQRSARDKDKRRLFLLSEGTIARDTPLYEKLSRSEINMREASAKQRQSFIKNNPSLHISLTRLSIRNIPRNITSKNLKALAREAVVGFATDVKTGRRQPLSKEEIHRSNIASKDADHERKLKGKGIVKQAKIVFESEGGGKVPEQSGAGRSRGYGFIEYVSHRSALMGLRWLNGHAVGTKDVQRTMSKEDVQERKKRLIVEFAIENAVVIGRRQEREGRVRDNPRTLVKNSLESASVNMIEIDGHKSYREPKKNWSKENRKRKRDKLEAGSNSPSKRLKASKETKPAKKTEPIDDKVAQRNRIIGRKRMARKAKRSG